MTLRVAVRMSIEAFDTMRFMSTKTKPQATLERAMGHISRHEADLGLELGDALAILGKAHNQVVRERNIERSRANVEHQADGATAPRHGREATTR